jgi:hypothetical protein
VRATPAAISKTILIKNVAHLVRGVPRWRDTCHNHPMKPAIDAIVEIALRAEKDMVLLEE